MTSATFRLVHAQARARAVNAVQGAPAGCTVKIEEPKRNLDQNAALWSLLTEISLQAYHPITGARLAPEIWKSIVMSAFGIEVTTVPSLDGLHGIPIGLSTSKLSKKRFSELLDFTHALAAELGVLIHDRVAA